MAKDLTWEEAILRVLGTADGALHYADIAERITSQRLKTSVGATPAATVAAILSLSLKEDDSPFQRVAKGEYALKRVIEEASAPLISSEAGADPDTGALRAFGMYWQRDLVVWSGKPRLQGRQGLGASEVNFAEQVGVYLLHDRDRVIYVGRAADTVFARLKAHTTDRLGGRWDRFSWFGLKSVTAEGTLSSPIVPWTHDVVIDTMEALLIESLEPPLNRRRGDNFSAAEYLQVADPTIEGSRRRQVLSDLAKAAGINS